jgi:hypothetical protein
LWLNSPDLDAFSIFLPTSRHYLRFPIAQGERLLPCGATGVLMLLALNLLTAGVAPGGRAANAQLH